MSYKFSVMALLAACICVSGLSAQDLCTCASCVSRAQGSAQLGFGLYFGKEPEASKLVELLNADPHAVKKFSSLLVHISSDGVRVGGGRLTLKGNYFDSQTKAVISVHAMATITELDFRIYGIPPGKYQLELTSSGHLVWDQKIVHTGNDSPIDIKIAKPRTVWGTIEGLPVTPSKSLFMYGLLGAEIDHNGKFSSERYVNKNEVAYVVSTLPNPHKNIWNEHHIRYAFPIPLAAMGTLPLTYKVPQLSAQVNFEGIVVLDPILQQNRYEKMFRQIIVEIRASDGSVSQFCTPDELGNFMGVGLPKGDYTIHLNDSAGNLPFITDPQSILIGAGKIAGVIQVPIKSP